VDIGADELDGNIVAGFVNGTRIMTGAAIPNAGPGLQDHQRVFFFGLIGHQVPRPVGNTILGRLFPWYNHVQAPTDASHGNFTDVDAGRVATSTLPLRYMQVTSYDWPRPPIPRELECDFSGHLPVDFHPLWGTPIMGAVAGATS